jgi:DNA-binding CsgD family transcriptional regulator
MMKQSFLPGFPEGAQKIGAVLSIMKQAGWVSYFVGGEQYYSHPEHDKKGQRWALATLMANGHVQARELEAAPLCLAHRTLMNWSAQHRERGPASFYAAAPRQKERVMTPQKVAQCAQLLAAGHRVAEVARRAGIRESTLRKAIARKLIAKPAAGALPEAVKAGSTKAERSQLDAQAAAGIGTACTRVEERLAVALGLAQGAGTRFEHCRDVAKGAVLVSLPALCANGLLSGIGRHLKLPVGFYSCLHILLTLGFMALARIRRPEGLRHIAPGELGKALGLDRVPEVRTLREKITLMARTGDPAAWMKELSRSWMQGDAQEAGYLYIDGHVRVYHGSKAQLPRRYVSRERLCLRGTTDYWINDALGQPFFVVSKAVTAGLAETLCQDIVPELLAAVPAQPTPEQLTADANLHRFVLIFDREGATASLLGALWEKRIGAITYRKNVKELWPESEFSDHEVAMPGGELTCMKLAMRDTVLLQKNAALRVKEVRRLTPTGHQTAVISTARALECMLIAGRMFSRWCQENFFSYMMEHFDIDGLVQYGAQELPGTLQVVNPQWRKLDQELRAGRQRLRKLQAQLGAHSAEEEEDAVQIQRKAECLEDIQALEEELQGLRVTRRQTARKVTLDSLPPEQRPTELLPLNKMLTDTVKMIAYRAETALVALLRRHLNKEDEARALVRELFVSSADIEPDEGAKTLTIRIHRMASPVHDRAIAALLQELTHAGFCHPATGARMIYTLV